MKALGWSAIMFASGMSIPIMAALNGQLGGRIGAPTAALTLFVVALVSVGAVVLASPRPAFAEVAAAPVWLFAGGFMVAFYVLSITLIGPKIGVAQAILFVLLGQMVSAAIVDHYGLFGARLRPIDLTRTAGLALMALGAFLALRPPPSAG